jgi:quercetin dioxygenase-like cupin family protein
MQIIAAVVLAGSAMTSASTDALPVRTAATNFTIAPAKLVTHIQTAAHLYSPGQEMPEHVHSVPVVCFVTKGAFIVSIGAAPPRRADVGEAILEPVGTVTHLIRNASGRRTAELGCAFLAGSDDGSLTAMLKRGGR